MPRSRPKLRAGTRRIARPRPETKPSQTGSSPRGGSPLPGIRSLTKTNERNAMSDSARSGGQLELPANTVRVDLPRAEVCMHLFVAGVPHDWADHGSQGGGG